MIHLLRTAAGIPDLTSFADFQTRFRIKKDTDLGKTVVVQTRNTPKRADEVLDGGALYWIIKNKIQAKQAVWDIRTAEDEQGRKICQFFLDPEIIRVVPVQQRAVQGWRYLENTKTPIDIGPLSTFANDEEPPADIARELKELSLL